MVVKVKGIIWSVCILLCYPLYSVGQLYLFFSKQKESDFYKLINNHSSEWISAHLFLLISLILLVPAFIALCSYFKNTRSYMFVLISSVFIILSAFSLFGQFTIDLCIVDIFKLPEDTAYKTLDNIQNDPLIKALFYDNSKLFFVFKYTDFTLLGHLFLGFGIIISTKIPLWAKVLFFIALLLTQLGILIDPFYGRIIKRASYALISISLFSVARSLLKNKQ